MLTCMEIIEEHRKKEKELLDELAKIESGARVAIAACIAQIEQVTGRTLVDAIKIGCELPKPHFDIVYLRAYVREVAKLIRDHWSFSSPCEFWEWAQDIFTSSWENDT